MGYRPLGECIESVIDHRGLTPKKLGGDWSQFGYRALSAKNVKNGALVQEDAMNRVSNEMYHRWMPEEVERGDVFITSEAPFGEVLYWDSDEKLVLSQRVFGLKVNRDICDSRYLYYWMQSPFFQGELRGRATGTTVVGLRQPELLRCIVKLPARDIQTAIAHVLGAIDSKITLNKQINGYLEELLLAQFTALSPNENWTEGRADSYYEIGIGKTPPRKEPEWFSDVKADNHVWLSIKDMGEAGTYSLDSSEYLTDAAVNAKNVRRVPAGSVLLSFKLTVGRVKIAGCNMTTNEAIACFASDDKRKLAYAYPYLRSFDYGKLGSTSSIATAVNSKTVKAMPFAMPDDLELSEFYLSTKPIYEQLLTAAKESRFLSQLRDALLPKLMSGEIDVSKVELTQLNSHLSGC